MQLVQDHILVSQTSYTPNIHTLFYAPFDSIYSDGSSTFFPELVDTATTPDPKDCRINGRSDLFTLTMPGRIGSAALIANSLFPDVRSEGNLACGNTMMTNAGDGTPHPDYTIGLWIRRQGNLSGHSGEGTRFLTFMATTFLPHQFAKVELGANGTVSLSAGQCAVSGTKIVTDGAWHQVIAVFDRTPHRLRTYIDGVLDVDAGCDTGPLTGSNVQYLAAAENGDFTFNGNIDDLWVEDHAWTQAEVDGFFGR
jgi:hypothetical protein